MSHDFLLLEIPRPVTSMPFKLLLQNLTTSKHPVSIISTSNKPACSMVSTLSEVSQQLSPGPITRTKCNVLIFIVFSWLRLQLSEMERLGIYHFHSPTLPLIHTLLFLLCANPRRKYLCGLEEGAAGAASADFLYQNNEQE